MKRAPISASLSLMLMFGIAACAMAQGKTSNKPVRRAVQDSSYTDVHIVPTTMNAGGSSIEVGGDRWSARGYDLKALISQIYDIDARRIDLADNGLADTRYDVTLTLPREVDDDVMQQMLKTALEKKFKLNIQPESRSMDVYVLTAPNGPGTELHRHAVHTGGIVTLTPSNAADLGSGDEGQITYFGKQCSGVSSGNGIAATAGTISEFRRTLEPDLDQLLVDETNLNGSYDFKIGNYANQQELFKLMQEELGILVTPAQRTVTMLTVRPTQVMQAAL